MRKLHQITGARKCNINRYLVQVNKTSLNNKTTVSSVSGFNFSTSTNGQWIQQIRKLQIAMLSSYFRWFLYDHYHLNNLSSLSGLIRKFGLFHVTGNKKSSPHCSCMNLLFYQVNLYPFCSVLNEYKERTLWTFYGWIGIFSFTFIIRFWERLLSIPNRRRLLFLDIAMAQYFCKNV